MAGLGCCGGGCGRLAATTGALVAAVAVLLGLLIARLPPAVHVTATDACANHRAAAGAAPRTLPGLPFECGWHELRPSSGNALLVYLQPVGSWCWSNAGFIQGSGGSQEGLLIDTLTDPVLTSGMLQALAALDRGGGGLRPAAVAYTHADIDHVLGDQELPAALPRLGRAELHGEMRSQAAVIQKASSAFTLGRMLWETAEFVGWRALASKLPPAAWWPLRKLLGWAHMQSLMARFNFHAVDPRRMVGLTVQIDDSRSTLPLPKTTAPSVELLHMGGVHSKSDSIFLVPDSKVCFAGDLLFIGIAPVMWGGPAKAWVAALDALLRETSEDWLFVPGHGPVTDTQGVRLVKRYFEYLDEGVTQYCGDIHRADDATCAASVLQHLPSELREAFAEPQRILISARIELESRRTGRPAKTDILTKAKLLGEQGEYLLEALR